MRSRCMPLAIANAVFAISTATPPAAQAETIAILGQASLSCLNGTEVRNAPMSTADAKLDRAGEEAWVIGFLSGAGAYSKGRNPLRGMEAIDILTSIDDSCAVHPHEPMVSAAVAFMDRH